MEPVKRYYINSKKLMRINRKCGIILDTSDEFGYNLT